MNIEKLNSLAASAMGWHKVFYAWEDDKDDFMVKIDEWNPCEDLNDASALLEKVVNGGSWTLVRGVNGLWCWTGGREEQENHANADTIAITVMLCALRCAGIPESSITEATGD